VKRKNGFTLLEVMLGLAILGFALTVLVKSASVSMQGAFDTQNMSIATELARGKMNDIEEMLVKEGFTDTDQSVGTCGETKERVPLDSSSSETAAREGSQAIEKELDEREREMRERWKSGKPFEEEGFPNFGFTYRVEQVELPSWQELQSLAQGQGSGSGSGSGDGFQNSALGGMLSQLGGGFGGGNEPANIDAVQGGAFIQGQYSLVQNVLKASIRKVTLCVYYEANGRPNEVKTVAYFTDAQAMDKVLQGLGAQELPETSGSGSSGSGGGGTGSGRGSGRGSNR
jgi:prepilin-type N-terminal cleavage/methylation domain-containing protein